MKKLNLFALMLLLIGQMTLGPIAVVSTNAGEDVVPEIEAVPETSRDGAGGENAEGGLLGKDGKPINQVANAGGEQATLPQTGEQSLLYIMIIGFALILLGGMMIGRRKTNK